MNIITSEDDVFSQLYSEFHHKYSPSPYLTAISIEYCKSYHKDDVFEDCSFVVQNNGQVIACFIGAVAIDHEGRTELSAFKGYPAFYFEKEGLPLDLKKRLNKVVKQSVEAIISKKVINKVSFLDNLVEGELNTISLSLLNLGALATPYFTQFIDLSLSEEERKRSLRKSYKSLINWGNNNLDIEVLDSDNVTWDKIDAMRRLHIEVAGRETRSEKSWERQYEGIKKSEGFAVFATLDGQLVSATLFFYNMQNCSYAVAVSRRELFAKPISHALLWRAMSYAKNKGCRYFELGEQLYPNQGNPSEKELGITKFKRGFGGSAMSKNLITLDIS
jgi:FemAB family protein